MYTLTIGCRAPISKTILRSSRCRSLLVTDSGGLSTRLTVKGLVGAVRAVRSRPSLVQCGSIQSGDGVDCDGLDVQVPAALVLRDDVRVEAALAGDAGLARNEDRVQADAISLVVERDDVESPQQIFVRRRPGERPRTPAERAGVRDVHRCDHWRARGRV